MGFNDGSKTEAALKILLAIDDSKYSQAAARAVIEGMRSDCVEVCALHVVEPIWLAIDYELGEVREIKAAHQEGIKRGKELLERIKLQLAGAGFKVTDSIEDGDPRFIIVDHSLRWKADLIVLGSHGRRGVARLLLGSVAEYVVRHTACSVLIVRIPPTEEAPQRSPKTDQ